MSKNDLYKAIEDKFVTLPDEKLILVQRKHWGTFMFPVTIALSIGILFLIASTFAYKYADDYPLVIFLSLLSLFIFISTLAVRSVFDWYFNLYVVTNKKIIEVSFRPMLSRQINAVFLDQVKCTEIDTKIEGLLNEFLDVGDVVITFDRPTHQEEFALTYIKDPKNVENYLQEMFSTGHTLKPEIKKEDIWYLRGSGSDKQWKYMEKIAPRGGETTWSTQN